MSNDVMCRRIILDPLFRRFSERGRERERESERERERECVRERERVSNPFQVTGPSALITLPISLMFITITTKIATFLIFEI